MDIRPFLMTFGEVGGGGWNSYEAVNSRAQAWGDHYGSRMTVRNLVDMRSVCPSYVAVYPLLASNCSETLREETKSVMKESIVSEPSSRFTNTSFL